MDPGAVEVDPQAVGVGDGAEGAYLPRSAHPHLHDQHVRLGQGREAAKDFLRENPKLRTFEVPKSAHVGAFWLARDTYGTANVGSAKYGSRGVPFELADLKKAIAAGTANEMGDRATAKVLDELERTPDLKGVMLTGKPYIFAAGADLTEIPFITTFEQGYDIGKIGQIF